MSSNKRKMPPTLGGGLQRRVRPRVQAEPDSDLDEVSSQAPSEEGVDFSGSESGSEDEDDDHSGSDSDESDSDSAPSEAGKGKALDPSQISFGKLAKAQAELGSMRKKSGKKGADDEEEDQEEDARQREWDWEQRKKRAAEKHARSSKHAPMEMTSKKQVSRRRDFIEVPTIKPRDPRFGPPVGRGAPQDTVIDEIKARKAYSFLDQYQDDEMNQLRAAIKKTKDPAAKEELQKTLASMESRKKARVRKERERLLLEEHRKQEKELVKQGKKPFYLKKAEQKKQLLLDQYASMKKGQVDKAIERKRKKVAGKEKKSLPLVRRTAADR